MNEFKPEKPKIEKQVHQSVFNNGGAAGFNLNAIPGAIDVGASVNRIKSILIRLESDTLTVSQRKTLTDEKNKLIEELQKAKVDLNEFLI